MSFPRLADALRRLPGPAWWLVAALFALSVLAFGIGEPTGLTGKDEYFLGLRIPLEMMESDTWWIPFIDGEPRLRKPPFVYWLTRISYETFGPSLSSARLVTVFFALLLLASTAWLGRLLGGKWQNGLLAAAILLGFAGIATESRRLMLDIPVAALSTAAFCAYLAWLRTMHRRWLLAVPALLTAAMMTKGPVALIAFGSGFLALWLSAAPRRTLAPALPASITGHFRQHALAYVLCGLLACLLPALWYWNVIHAYPAQFAAAAQDEMEARSNGSLSLIPLSGLFGLTLPWIFIGLHSLIRHRRAPEIRLLGLWLLISLLPFFFLRSFERYLIGSLPAFALICAYGLQHAAPARWPARLGAFFPILVVAVLIALLWRWGHGGAALAVGGALFVFALCWWRADNNAALALSAAWLWPVVWGIGFPQLGVNAVPDSALQLVKDRQVLLFEGPQPALLPILTQRAMRHVRNLDEKDAPLAAGTLIAVSQDDDPLLQQALAAKHLGTKEVLRYQALTSAGSGVRFARQGTTAQDWQAAWAEGSPARLMSTVIFYELRP